MKRILFSLFISCGIVACSGSSQSSSDMDGVDSTGAETIADAKSLTTASGVKIDILEPGDGVKPNTGDIVTVNYTGKLASNGEVFDSSVNSGRPFKFSIGKGQVIRGWDEGIAELSTGAKANLYIPANLGYGAQATGSIPENSDLIFEVEIMEIAPAPTPMTHETYPTEGLTSEITTSGLEYFIIEKGDGPKIESGSVVKVHYFGYLKDGGEKFDSSFERGQPIELTVGTGQVIPGWEEGLALLSEGAKAKLIIPHALAYGETGYPGVIPPSADLVFDVQIMKVN